MDEIFDYICDEIEELEQKVQKDGKLSMAEIEYLDKLEHIKKDMLTSEAMMDSGYSRDGDWDGNDDGNMDGMSGRGRRGGRSYNYGYSGRRDSMGRYTSNRGGRRYSRDEAKSEISRHLEKAMDAASSEKEREVLQNAMNQLKNM